MAVSQAYIKDISLHIDNEYEFDNSPISLRDILKKGYKPPPFLGRIEVMNKFLEFLRSPLKKGVFLVTGYRGMGKTSFVNHTLYKYYESLAKPVRLFARRPAQTIIPISISMTQSRPKEIDILKLLTSKIYDEYRKCPESGYQSYIRIGKIRNFLRALLTLATFLLIVTWFAFSKSDQLRPILPSTGFPNGSAFRGNQLYWWSWIGPVWVYIAALTGVYTLWSYWRVSRIMSESKPLQGIQFLYQRCFASIEKEITEKRELSIDKIIRLFTGSSRRSNTVYPIAQSKEIEYALSNFLEMIEQQTKIEFIIIFDELDKIDPVITPSYLYDDISAMESKGEESSYQKEQRDRKQAIINIIAGLKNFLTTAPARFIFVAGREMFDASLADISDRQSSISSVFTHVFYIESFLRENRQKASMSALIEEYLSLVLFGPDETKTQTGNFGPDETKMQTGSKKEQGKNDLFQKVRDEFEIRHPKMKKGDQASDGAAKHNEDAWENSEDAWGKNSELALNKLIFSLQNFVVYLTYRSNGSPKKLVKTIHEFIRVNKVYNGEYTSADFRYDDKVIDARRKIRDDPDPETGSKGQAKNKRKSSKEVKNRNRFLYFDFYDQYRIGFISYLYRPFLVKFGGTFKHYSDNIIVSTPYLFDHLLKFHPFAFSITNLELIPEVLSTTKTPALREHIMQIIHYLGNSHIRETEIGLFDYKFYSRTYNEIVFVSKTFEEESAAFNFTLDEGFLVKLHVANKIKGLRNMYQQYSPGDNIPQQVFSIAHLNGVLGDLHFFDQEFDDAIVAYSDAIRLINHLVVDDMNIRDFVTLIRYKLKLGLCFEKIKSYEEALAFYSDSSQDAQRFMASRLYKGTYFTLPLPGAPPASIFHTSALSDLLQIINQCFIAEIIIQEKMGVEGISASKIGLAFGGFLKIAESVSLYCGSNELVIANSYLLLGNLLYFKNSQCWSENPHTFFEAIPEHRRKELEQIVSHYTPFFGGVNQRKPLLAICFYCLALNEVMTDRDMIPGFHEGLMGAANPAYGILYQFKPKDKDESNQRYFDEDNQRYTGTHYKHIAILLSNIGDCLLSMLKREEYQKNTLEAFFDVTKLSSDNERAAGLEAYLREPQPDVACLSDILRLYLLSARYFNKMGREVSSSLQYRKILRVLRIALKEGEIGAKTLNTTKSILNLLEIHVLSPMLLISGKNSEFSDRHMVTKLTGMTISSLTGMTIPPLTGTTISPREARNNISNHPETRSAVFLFLYIRMKALYPTEDLDINELVNPYNSFATQHARVVELDFFAKHRYLTFKKMVQDGKEGQISLTELATDYLFSMLAIIKILKVYGTDYSLGYSYYAYTHFRIGEFIVEMEKMQQQNEDKELMNNIRSGVERMLGTGSHTMIDKQYHFLMAKGLYEKAVRLHTAGPEYKTVMAGLIYLEDDINDNAYHFGAALDRFLMSKGTFENMIRKCSEWAFPASQGKDAAEDNYRLSAFFDNLEWTNN